MKTTYTGARPYRDVDGGGLYQYREDVFATGELVGLGYLDGLTRDGWGDIHDRYENTTGRHYVWRRELEINTMAIGFNNVVSVDEARGLETGRTVAKNDFLISRLVWESVEQLVNLIEVFRWTIIGAFHVGDHPGRTEIIIIKSEDDTPVFVYPHEKVLGRVQRVLAL